MSRLKLSSRVALSDSVKQTQEAYKKARKKLLLKAYTKPLKGRMDSLRKDFKLHKAFGVLTTFLGLRLFSDYKAMKSSGLKGIDIGLRARIDAIGYALSNEVAKNPSLRNALITIEKQYPYLSVNKKGEIFVSSYSGSVFDSKTIPGMIFGEENRIPSKREIVNSKKTRGYRLNLKTILAMGSPKHNPATTSSKIKGTRTSSKNVTLAGYGDNEIRLFTPAIRGGVVNERRIISNEVRTKNIINSPTTGKKIIKLLLNDGEQIRIEVDTKIAEKLFKGFKLKK